MESLISVQVDKNILDEAAKIFNNLGMSIDEAINLFLEYVVDNKKLPFEMEK